MIFLDCCCSPAEQRHECHAEPAARAAARARLWLAEQLPAIILPAFLLPMTLLQSTVSLMMTHQTAATISTRRPSRSHFVTRSQILRKIEPPTPEELEEHRLDTEKMFWRGQAARHPMIILSDPESASGTTRVLRPPDVEGMSILALYHCPAGRVEANQREALRGLSLCCSCYFCRCH